MILVSTFLEVIAWIVIAFFFMLFLWLFIAVFTDIFRRHDISGFVKVLWVIGIFILPLIGVLVYMLTRPPLATHEQDMQLLADQRRMMGISATEEIAKAHEMLAAGQITQADFDKIKARALN